MAKTFVRRYEGFRGVDKASDPTLCGLDRSPYMVNMYKDYRSTLGKAVETIPGTRLRVNAPTINSVTMPVTDFYFYTKIVGGITYVKPILHIYDKLYLWSNYPNDVGVEKESGFSVVNGVITLGFTVDQVKSVKIDGVETVFSLSNTKNQINVNENYNGVLAKVCYVTKNFTDSDLLYSGVSTDKLNYFTFNNTCYIIDGEKYLSFDGEEIALVSPYVPTTYIGITAESVGQQFEFRNFLTKKFKNTFAANGEATTFYLSEKDLDAVTKVTIYGVETSGFTVDLTNGSVTFSTPPSSPISQGYDDGYSGITIEAEKDLGEESKITGMKTSEIFDGRVFLTSHDQFYDKVVYSALLDPTYFPDVNYLTIGNGSAKCVGLLAVNGELFAFSGNGGSGGVYTLKETDTDFVLNPKIYVVTAVSSYDGISANPTAFMDMPTYLTKSGLKQLTSPNLKLERRVEKRSSLIDSALLKEDLQKATVFSFDGYLCVYVNGTLYMGDSRRNYKNEQGEYEYEWFEITEVGSYENQYVRYAFKQSLPNGVDQKYLAPKELLKEAANPPKEDGTPKRTVTNKTVTVNGENVTIPVFSVSSVLAVGLADEVVYETVEEEYMAEEKEDYIGGTFNCAEHIGEYDGNIYFCNKLGLYSFNFDKRVGKLTRGDYSFNNRTIKCGVATLLDNAGYPERLKRTIPKSLVIKCKTFDNSGLKVKVRTDKTAFKAYGELDAGYFDFQTLDFLNLNFNTSDQQIFVLNEKEKNWSEKQIFLYSDEYQRPFSVYYLTYEYAVKGKIKNTRR